MPTSFFRCSLNLAGGNRLGPKMDARKAWMEAAALERLRIARFPARLRFPFNNLVVEIQLVIVEIAITSFPRFRKTLRSVSRRMRDLVEMLPLGNVLLRTREHLKLFSRFLASSSEAKFRVRRLWVIMPHPEALEACDEEEFIIPIVQACSEITSLVCNARTLIAAICSEPDFRHTKCRELTLMETDGMWRMILSTAHGRTFFGQLTHLRAILWTTLEVPADLTFSHLTHFSFPSSSVPTEVFINSILLAKNAARFPVLKQIVVTIGEIHWPWMVYPAIDDVDSRVFVFLHSRKWPEGRLWKQGRYGPQSLWSDATLPSVRGWRGRMRCDQNFTALLIV